MKIIRIACELITLAGVAIFCGTTSAAEPAAKMPPNIVILLADDLGWKDVSYHGAPFETPNIDQLVVDGVELNRFYSCPVCSPTRAGLMTGRWPIRFGLMRSVIPPWRDFGMPTDERTIAEALAEQGYESRAIIGKWHLGHRQPKWLPLNQGFTHFYGHYNGALDYYTHVREGEVDWHRNGKTIDEQGYTTELLANEAVRFIKESAKKDAPFFLYVPFNAPHGPLQPPRGSLEKFQDIKNKKRRKLAAMTVALDNAVGKIVAAIDQAGATENTIVWFFSDNGGHLPASSNAPLRGHKAQVYEGGVRVPAVVKWPGILPAGTRCEQVMGYIDVMPTLCAIAGGEPKTINNSPITDLPPKAFDGINVLPAIRDGKPLPPRTWYHFISQNGDPSEQVAVLEGGWKLVITGGNLLDPAQAKQRKIELFHLAEDPLEEHNLMETHPDRVKRLSELAVAFRKLQPERHLPRYGAGRKGFVAPEGWKIESIRN